MRTSRSKKGKAARSSSKPQDIFIYGDWIILDHGKVDRTIRPTTIDWIRKRHRSRKQS